MRDGVTLVIPTIKPRRKLLLRAIESALNQRRPFTDIWVENDTEKKGAGPTRTRGLMAAQTKWVAFLDDDDELYPDHLDVLIHAIIDYDADLVYPWFDVKGGSDPFPMFEGKEFDPDVPNMFPVTVLARTELLQRSHGFPLAKNQDGDDWPLWQELVSMGAKIRHVPQRTWCWHHHGSNSAGRPDRW